MRDAASTWLRPLAFGIRWAPLAWFLGLAEPFVAAAVVLSAVSLTRGPWTRLLLPALGMASFLLAGAISLVLAADRGAPTDRVAAASFNLLVWGLGFTVWLIVRRHGRPGDRRLLLQSIRDAGMWAVAAAVVALIGWNAGLRSLSFPALAAQVVPLEVRGGLPGLFASALQPIVYRTDFFAGVAIPRLQAFHPYPNALALTAALAIAAQLALMRWGRPSTLRSAIVLAILTLPLAMTASRAILLATLALTALTVALRMVPRDGRIVTVAAAAWLLTLAATFAAALPQVGSALASGVGDARAGSTMTRVTLYAETLRQAIERPWLGHGVKPRPEDRGIPIGSHSTLIGTFYKGGAVGLVLLVAASLLIAARSIRDLTLGDQHRQAVAAAATLVLAWALIEDLDAALVASIQAFAMLGLLFWDHAKT